MNINVVIDADKNISEKIKYGFTLLLRPIQAEVTFTNSVMENGINIFYGPPSHPKKKIFCLTPSNEFGACIKNSTLPGISQIGWLEFGGKRLPKLLPVRDSSCDFDIAAAAFILASEFQDLISIERDEFDRLRAMDSMQDKLGILDFPVVNYYSMFLKKKLEEFFSVKLIMKKYGEVSHALALTHDIDYTSSLNPRMIKRNIFGHAILNHGELTVNERTMKLLYPLFAVAGYDPPKAGMKFLKNTENSKGLRSTFFIKTGVTARQDMNYSNRSSSFRRYIGSLLDNGFEIGIHPSMKTYINGEQLITEKGRLERLIGKQVISVRQHYLKFIASKTVGIWEDAGLKYDGTLGFSRKAGFRNSVAFPFPLYNFEKDRTSTVIELPLLIMDDTFADNKSRPVDETVEKMKKLIDETKVAHGAASILFHNSLTDPIDFPDYDKIYERILTGAENDGFKMDSLAGIIEEFR